MKNKEAEKILTKDIGITLSEFPKNITLKYDEKEATLTMELSAAAAGLVKDKFNMQDDAAAFEAWALIIKAEANYRKKNLKKIVLGVKGVSDSDYNIAKPSNGCLGRFLYRILKFKEQYGEWFDLSNILKGYRDNFISYLSGEHEFKNNVPVGEAETNEYKLWNKGLEKYAEWMFGTDNELKENILGLAKDTIIDRQLPVGLYEDEVKKDNVVFTGGSAAIDFWALDDKEKVINVYELKTKNKMVGVLTEIFFYSNYVNDIFVNQKIGDAYGKIVKSKIKNAGKKVSHRNYEKLELDLTNYKVNGIMICDVLHSDIIDNWEPLIKLMNTNGVIDYSNIKFELELPKVKKSSPV
ncbi:hypothetical protein [Phascolarctobacterium succinatutens]|uniref:hypothetical protein n=1 Tax=Phascolarctobacterium succinatutens TaxID=626940 RepID=UPI003AAC16ED